MKRVRSSDEEGGTPTPVGVEQGQDIGEMNQPTSTAQEPSTQQENSAEVDIQDLLDVELEDSGGPARPARPVVSQPSQVQLDTETGTATSPATSPTSRTPTRVTALAKAMAIDGGNRLDVGASRSSRMRSELPSSSAATPSPSAAELTMNRNRSRSPPPIDRERDTALMAEFVCFLAKRKGKPDSNEINYGKADAELRKRLDDSRAKEWSNWLKYKAIRFPPPEEVEQLLQGGEDVIPMRWVDVDKNAKIRTPGDDSIPEKLKSRLVIRGDLERQSFRTDCPTASGTAIHILLSFSACNQTEIKSGDISAAFLQGAPIQRTLILSAPKDGIPTTDGWIDPYTYLIALMSVYGSKDAPRGFYLELRKTLVTCGLTEVDPAMYALIHEGETQGLLCSHVDDLIWTGNYMMDEVMEKVQQRFTFGSTDQGSFRFCGRKLESNEKFLYVNCPETLSKVKQIHIEGGRQRDLTSSVSDIEQSQMRAVLGSVGWVARLCRPELCYQCSALQGKQS